MLTRARRLPAHQARLRLPRSRKIAAAVAAGLAIVGFTASPASATFTYTVGGGIACTMHATSDARYNGMYCNTSYPYHFTSSACRSSCQTLSSNTASGRGIVGICAPSGAGLSNSFTVYIAGSNRGTYSPARDNGGAWSC